MTVAGLLLPSGCRFCLLFNHGYYIWRIYTRGTGRCMVLEEQKWLGVWSGAVFVPLERSVVTSRNGWGMGSPSTRGSGFL